MPLELRDLGLFIAIAESRSLTGAAERVHLSLSAVSARVKELEEGVGVRLLYRSARGVTPTPAGESLLRHARGVLADVELMNEDLRRFGQGIRGHLRVFASTSAVTEFLPRALVRFLKDRPGIDVELQERNSIESVRGVLDGNADLGIVSGAVDADAIDSLCFDIDRLVLVTPVDHALAMRDAIKLDDLLGVEYVGMHDGSTLQGFVRTLLQGHRQRLRMRVQVRSYEAVCCMAEGGVGVGIVPESAAIRYGRTMRIATVPIDEPWAVRDYYLLTRTGESLTAFARELMDAIVRQAQEPREPSPAGRAPGGDLPETASG